MVSADLGSDFPFQFDVSAWPLAGHEQQTRLYSSEGCSPPRVHRVKAFQPQLKTQPVAFREVTVFSSRLTCSDHCLDFAVEHFVALREDVKDGIDLGHRCLQSLGIGGRAAARRAS